MYAENCGDCRKVFFRLTISGEGLQGLVEFVIILTITWRDRGDDLNNSFGGEHNDDAHEVKPSYCAEAERKRIQVREAKEKER